MKWKDVQVAVRIVVAVAMNAIVMEPVETKDLLKLSWSDFDLELKQYALEHHVPIMVDEGLAFLEQIIRIKRPKKILEIGTAIGFSAIRMHKVIGSKVTTIERDSSMVELATRHITQMGFQKDIRIIHKDALEAFDFVKNETFDLIFIDAAKAQYQKFFDLYTPLLSSHGIVLSDNMAFHGLVFQKEEVSMSRSVRGLIRKISNYQEYILHHSQFNTTIFSIGDGIALSIKKD